MINRVFVLVAACLIAAAAHANEVVALANLTDDKVVVRNGAVLFARINVDVVNATSAQASLPLGIIFFPADRRPIDFLTISGKEMSASGFWMALTPGKNILAVSPPPGTYYWHSLIMGTVGTAYSSPTGRANSLKIVEKKTNYVGDYNFTIDLDSKKVSSQLSDHFDEAIIDLEAARPALLEEFDGVRSVPPKIGDDD